MLTRHARIILFGLLLALNLPAARADTAREYELKAALMFKFAQFTDWPAAPAADFNFCVLGQDVFGDALGPLRERTLRNAAVTVRKIATVNEAKTCQTVFLNAANIGQLKQWVAVLKTLPVLTISDSPDAWDEGVMIQLRNEPNRIGFNINLTAARQAGLNFQAQMLTLAREVR